MLGPCCGLSFPCPTWPWPCACACMAIDMRNSRCEIARSVLESTTLPRGRAAAEISTFFASIFARRAFVASLMLFQRSSAARRACASSDSAAAAVSESSVPGPRIPPRPGLAPPAPVTLRPSASRSATAISGGPPREAATVARRAAAALPNIPVNDPPPMPAAEPPEATEMTLPRRPLGPA